MMVHTMSVKRIGELSLELVPPSIPVQTEFGFRLSALNPKYLHTNSTSHTWPFSAIAELVDNAYDPDVKASQLHIDLKSILKDGHSELTMTFTDNGNGMTSEKLYKMLSFGFCEKVAVKNHKPVGHYGNGFKSGSMRIGKDALVFTKCPETKSVGFLSQTYLAAVEADTIIVPMVTWEIGTGEIKNPEEERCSLPAIIKHSVLGTLEQIEEEFEAITSDSGTRIIISKLRRTRDRLEFDIMSEKNDIRIPEDTVDSAESKYKREERQQHIPASDYSLRAYLSILYLKPKMQIYLRSKKVKTMVIRKSLSKTEVDVYKPQNEKPMKIVFGFSENVNHYGIMMYHSNRLIKPYVRVGCQLKANNQGIGVVGVIESNALQPTHNKQDFDYTPLFRATMNALGIKLNEYWNEKTKFGTVPPVAPGIEKAPLPDELWVQCDNTKCLKWRKLPTYIKKADLPEKWYCHMHPDKNWADCNIPEEEEPENMQITPYEKKLKKRTQQLKEMERVREMRKKTAEVQLQNLKLEQAEVANQMQQQEIMRLRNQLTPKPGQSSQTSSGTSLTSPKIKQSNSPIRGGPNIIARPVTPFNSNAQSPQVQGVSQIQKIGMNELPGRKPPLQGPPPRHPSSRIQGITAHEGAGAHLVNGHNSVISNVLNPTSHVMGPVVSQVYSFGDLIPNNNIQGPLKVESNTEGSNKRPISLDSDDDEPSPSSKCIKTEVSEPPCIDLSNSPQDSPAVKDALPPPEMKEEPIDESKTNQFILGMQRLLNNSPPPVHIVNEIEQKVNPDISQMTALLHKRTDSLRRLRCKIHDLSKILFPDVTLPDISKDIDDSAIEELLDTIIEAHKTNVVSSDDIPVDNQNLDSDRRHGFPTEETLTSICDQGSDIRISADLNCQKQQGNNDIQDYMDETNKDILYSIDQDENSMILTDIDIHEEDGSDRKVSKTYDNMMDGANAPIQTSNMNIITNLIETPKSLEDSKSTSSPCDGENIYAYTNISNACTTSIKSDEKLENSSSFVPEPNETETNSYFVSTTDIQNSEETCSRPCEVDVSETGTEPLIVKLYSGKSMASNDEVEVPKRDDKDSSNMISICLSSDDEEDNISGEAKATFSFKQEDECNNTL